VTGTSESTLFPLPRPPTSFLPQHAAVPSLNTAHVRESPHAIEMLDLPGKSRGDPQFNIRSSRCRFLTNETVPPCHGHTNLFVNVIGLRATVVGDDSFVQHAIFDILLQAGLENILAYHTS
jgi:hypothetical protein